MHKCPSSSSFAVASTPWREFQHNAGSTRYLPGSGGDNRRMASDAPDRAGRVTLARNTSSMRVLCTCSDRSIGTPGRGRGYSVPPELTRASGLRIRFDALPVAGDEGEGKWRW